MAVFLFLAAPALLRAQGIREAVVAGAFYDGDKNALASRVDAYLGAVPDLPAIAADVRALICPHAGYVYSGQTAAYAYRLVQGKSYDAVVVIGTSHQYPLDGCSIFLKGGFKTPLGIAPVDEELAAAIAKASGFGYVSGAHAKEHSVEVQVPFIQRALPGAKIVPIVMGVPTRSTISALGNALAEALEMKRVLIIASTDMSHYLSKKDANEVDARTISLLEKLSTDILINELAAGKNIMCGGGPVAASLIALRKRGTPRVHVLRYSDSSEVTQDERQVVGYLAAAVAVGSPAPAFALSPSEKKELLRLARQAVETFVRENKVAAFSTENPNFVSERGAFITLKKEGRLRGCIGFIEPLFPLYETVIRASIYAATEDARFPPVSSVELGELEYEISVLTPLTKIDDPRTVRVGKHGLVIARDRNRGLLLPQVPVENGWSRETFLCQACLKAGLPEDAWKKGAEIYVFEAIVFQ